ncbi:prolyl oligopeptidase family serine peptidase [Nocardiopsis sp. NPDC006832]|uniref:S9 family peptidase n=1 Tax=Nocardiopsis sp. NPDC006832 TaxID=3157188 RepID=UPI00340D62EF
MSELSSPHGRWPSPISAGDVARGTLLPAFPSVRGDEVWWQEYRPAENGRTTLVRRDSDGSVHDLLPAPWNVGTRVHEYGGRSYLPVPRRDDKAIPRVGVVFADHDTQRLFLLERGAKDPLPLTPEPARKAGLRYADPVLSPDGKQILCVREDHTGADLSRSIVSVPLSGRGATDPTAIRELVTGARFYASPAPSPDGRHLAYVRWNHPRMPWDGTELRVGELTETGLLGEYTLKGGVDESVLSPTWVDDDSMYLASDWPGFWNLYHAGLKGQAIALYPAEEEFHEAPGRLGDRSFCALENGKVVTLHGDTALRPALYDPDTLDLEDVPTDLTSWSQVDSDGLNVVAVAASPDSAPCVVRLDPARRSVEILRRSLEQAPDAGYLPTPRRERLPGRYGATVHANVYPPTHPDHDGSEPAPYVVWAHGGPVGHSRRELDLNKAYFTSRGIGVVDVDYGGSTGYGRSYRKRLHKEWGVVDVEDCAAVARALVDRGVADPERLAIRGPSAGGFTALLALTGDTFACGVSYFGVADLLGLAETTHDFESRFLDTLLGPLPGFIETYKERSPINRIAEIDVPVLLLQGMDDPVVTPDQAFSMATALGERGIPYALLEFEGESHGFHTEEARVRSLEAELAFYGKVFGFEPDVPALELSTTPPEPRPEPTPDPAIEPASTEAETRRSGTGTDPHEVSEDDIPVAEQLPDVTPAAGVTARTGEPVTGEPVTKDE